MTSMSDKTRDRLGKLIPRLASDQDPEVLATVLAIRSTLMADGLDLHDLAAAIAGSEVVSKTKPAQVQQAPSWAHLSHHERLGWLKAILRVPDIGELERDRLVDLYNRTMVGVFFHPHWTRVRLFDEHVARAFATGIRP
jgi:hypothetical protein